MADLNAAHATVTDEGTVIIDFGGVLQGGPELQVTEIKATGTFSGICPISSWSLQTSGTVTLARVARP